MKTRFKNVSLFMSVVLMAGLLAGCSIDTGVNTSSPNGQNVEGRQEPTNSEGQGTVVFGLSNEIFDVEGYSEFYVTIENIEVSTAGQGRVMVESSASEVDLIALRNAEYALLIGETDLDISMITQVRFDMRSMYAIQGDTQIDFEDIESIELPIQATIQENQYTYLLLDLEGTQQDIEMDSNENYYFSPNVGVTVRSGVDLYIEQENGEDRIRADEGIIDGEFDFSLRVYNQIELNDLDATNGDTLIDLETDTGVDTEEGVEGTLGTDTNIQLP